MKFKIGDRVAFYSCQGRIIYTVDNTFDKDIISLKDECGVQFGAHPKQCRLLKKKQRRRVWVNYGLAEQTPCSAIRYDCLNLKPNNTSPWIEFVEVKK